LILGFVLGAIVERFLFISVSRYGADFLLDPWVIILLAIALYGFFRPFYREVKSGGGIGALISGYSATAQININAIFYVGALMLMGVMAAIAAPWPTEAGLVPIFVGTFTMFVVSLSFINHMFREKSGGGGESVEAKATKTLTLDLQASDDHLETAVVRRRALKFLGWLLTFLVLVAFVGMLPTVFVFISLYMWWEGRENWKLMLSLSAGMTLFSWILFDQLLSLPWPRTILGTIWPAIKTVIPSM